MKATKIVLRILLLVVLALAGAAAYLPVYLEDHRDLIEAVATRALGRPVEIEGGRSPEALRIDAFQVLESTLAFQTAQGTTHRLGITRLDLRGLGGGKLVLEAALAYRDSPISVSATSTIIFSGG